MTRLGIDDLGTWLYAPIGAAASYAKSGLAVLPVNFLTLIPHEAKWWVSTWMWGNPTVDIELYVDIVHPPVWESESCLRVIDLDLDVIRHRDGTLEIDDEAEFESHSVAFGYPASVVAAARSTADEIFAAITANASPFGSEPRRWLAAVGN